MVEGTAGQGAGAGCLGAGCRVGGWRRGEVRYYTLPGSYLRIARGGLMVTEECWMTAVVKVEAVETEVE